MVGQKRQADVPSEMLKVQIEGPSVSSKAELENVVPLGLNDNSSLHAESGAENEKQVLLEEEDEVALADNLLGQREELAAEVKRDGKNCALDAGKYMRETFIQSYNQTFKEVKS